MTKDLNARFVSLEAKRSSTKKTSSDNEGDAAERPVSKKRKKQDSQTSTDDGKNCQKSSEKDHEFNPIKIDNWSSLLTQKLTSLYQREQLCDLALKFPEEKGEAESNKLMVHSLVVHACTDYFKIELAKQKSEDELVLPNNLSRSAMSDVVMFMYTGRLALKASNFEALYKAAKALGMNILTKLMENQLHQVIVKAKMTAETAKNETSLGKRIPNWSIALWKALTKG